MEKSLCVAIVLVTVFSIVSMLAPRAINVSSKGSLEVAPSSGIIWQDDFESYTVGSFPSFPWSLWTSGMGAAEQRIVDTASFSGNKSFRMYGSYGWSAIAGRPITVTANMKFGFEVMVLAENNGTPGNRGAYIAFASSKPSPALWRQWGGVGFFSDGKIVANVAGSPELASYTVNTWYKVREVFDAATMTFSVWINDELKASSLVDTNAYPATDIEALALCSDWAEQVCYFDDAKVFTVQAPSLSLTPDTGFATTTAVGSGFSNDSEVTIAWDGTVIPTAPVNATTDASGNFAVIISVPTQTAPGAHIVNATDESGNWGTATFTVANMTGPQGPQGLQGIQGVPGTNGTTWYEGNGTPSVGTGVNNDYYLNTANGDVYQKQSGSWTKIGNIQGSQGEKGNTGDTGPQGPSGSLGENQLLLIAFPTAASIIALCIAAVALLRKKS